MNGRILALLLGVAVAIGLLTLLLRDGGDTGAVEAQQTTEELDHGTAPAGEEMLGPGEQSGGVTSSEEREALKSEASPETPKPESVVTILVLEEGSRTPIEGATVWIAENGRIRPAEGRASGVAGERLRSDAEGRVTFTVPPGAELNGNATAKEVGFESSSIEVTPLQIGEQRRVEVLLARESRSFDYFLLVDRESGEPVSGAKLIDAAGLARFSAGIGTNWSDGKKWELNGPVVTESDGGGRFRLTYLSANQGRYAIHAEGYGPAWVVPSGEHPSPDDPLRIRISRTASMTGLVQSKGPGDIAPVTIGLLASSFALMDWESGNGRVVGSDLLWSTEIAPGGAYVLEGIPAHTELQLQIRAGTEVLYHHATPLKLQPGEEHVFDWTEGAGSAVFGELVDAQASPAGRQLWLVGATRRGQVRLLSIFDEPAYETLTDKEGQFRFEDVVPGAYWLGERPSPRKRNEGSFAILVDAPSFESVRLELPTNAVIAGQVVFDGKGVGDIVVSAWREDVLGNSPRTETDAEGKFELSLSVEGAWRLSTNDNNYERDLVGIEFLEFLTGTMDARLEVVQGVQFGGSIEDESGRPVNARVTLLPRSPGASSLAAFGYTNGFSFRGLTPGRYAIYAHSIDGLAGTSEEVELRAGEVITDHVVRLSPGAIVHVENTGESTRASASLTREGVVVVNLQLFGEKTGTLSVPPGTYQLVVRATPMTEPLSTREVTFVAGEETSLEINADG